ncbi:unnamed protein product, partial [Symbiodinium sp. CCMP2456]
MKLEEIFVDYLKSGGSWLESSLVVSTSSKKSKELESKEVFIRYCDLKKRDGAVTAKLIRDEKRALQEELDKKPVVAGEEPLPFVFAHPDLPGSEEWELIRVFDSAAVVARDKKTQEANLSTGPMELDGQQTRVFLPAALGFGVSAGSSAAGPTVLPQPSGLRSLGSKESLEKEAEQLKKMRKQGKGGTAGQVRTKVKQVNDKMTEADELIKKVNECEHVSQPLCKGYKDELEMHKAVLGEHIEKLQADGFDEGTAETVQQAFDDLTEKLKVPISWVRVPMLTSLTDNTVVFRKLPVILPHELLCYLSVEKIPEGEVDIDAVSTYWQHCKRYALSCGFDTIQAYLRPVVASLNACLSGFHPERPILGQSGDCEWPACVPTTDPDRPLVLKQGQPLRFAMTELRADWKFHKDSVMHSQPLFLAKHLRSKNGSEVELAAKAYNARVVTSWLADFVVELIHEEPYCNDDRLMHFLSELMNVIEASPRYLDDGQIDRMQYCQNASLAAYGLLAYGSAQDALS